MNRTQKRGATFGVGRTKPPVYNNPAPLKEEIKEDNRFNKGGMTTLEPNVKKTKEKKRMFQR